MNDVKHTNKLSFNKHEGQTCASTPDLRWMVFGRIFIKLGVIDWRAMVKETRSELAVVFWRWKKACLELW